jgi:hypothetical protein
MMTHSRACIAGLLVALGSVEGVASADTSAQDSAAAQTLYDEGRRLASVGQWSDACPKLAESQRLDPTPVTAFYLADCYEHVGRTASAWSTFLELAAIAHRTGGPKAADRERVARSRAAALEPKLARLEIDIPAASRVDGLVVKRDGEVVGEGQWGAPLPVDPGPHTVEARAPGKRPWLARENVQGSGQVQRLEVPVLQDEPTNPAQPLAPTPATAQGPDETHQAGTSSPLKTVGIVTAGVGAAGLVVGSILGLQALSKNSQANDGHCGQSAGFTDANTCDQQGVSLRRSAVNDGNISTLAFAVGGVVFATGAVLWIMAPSGRVQAAPAVGAGSAGVVVRGNF